MTNFFVCDNCNMSIFIQYSNVQEGVFCMLQMLRIQTGLRKCNKKDRVHMLLCDKNPLGIKRPCLMIAKNEVLFEQYRIDIQEDDEIKRNQLFF